MTMLFNIDSLNSVIFRNEILTMKLRGLIQLVICEVSNIYIYIYIAPYNQQLRIGTKNIHFFNQNN